MPHTLHRVHHQVKAPALCASRARDSMTRMPAKADKERGHTIPRVAWWCDAATAAVKASGLTHGQVATEVVKRFSYEVHATGITRCLSGKVLTVQLARHISAMFALPPPIIEPSSEAEALQLLGKQERERIRVQLGAIAAGVRKATEAGHTAKVKIADAGDEQAGPRRRRVERDR